MDTASASFQCPSCPAAYGKLEHLQRHNLSVHSAERPFACPFCIQAFARRDVLVRHLKTCKAKPNTKAALDVIAVHQRGRKRKSCDACIRQKKGCNGTQPCLPCVHRKQTCIYTDKPGPNPNAATSSRSEVEQWLQRTQDGAGGSEWNLEDATPGSMASEHAAAKPLGWPSIGSFSESSPGSHSNMYDMTDGAQIPASATNLGDWNLEPNVRRLEFLSNFTDTKGLASSFDCGSPEQRAIFIDCLDSQNIEPQLDRILAEKSHNIVTAIEHNSELLTRRRASDVRWPDSLKTACCEFFAPSQLHSHLAAYWALWHPNCPIIHKPTFTVFESPPMLLAVMALLGACLSPVPGHRESALLWFDPIEEWVFSAPELTDDPLRIEPSDQNSNALRERLDALRAAYCVILLQTWEGAEAAKRRARRSRYTDIIGVFRSVCNDDISHGDLSRYMQGPSRVEAWKEFAVKEELIRTLTYVVLLDAAYVIFNNTPPRMAAGEARFSLSCPESCFQADNVQAWTDAIQPWALSELGRRQPPVHQVISMLWADSLSDADEILLRSTSSLNLFILVHPLHVQLFHARSHPLPASQTALVRRALDAWRRIWLERSGPPGLEERTPTRPADCWKRLGFARHAPEFWCLADLILNSSESMQSQFYDQSDGFTGKSLISQLLSRYDESDMSQVHKLVDLFGSMQLAA
ncbi:hypothetical protein BST61_g2958 [Cercospora zeina]